MERRRIEPLPAMGLAVLVAAGTALRWLHARNAQWVMTGDDGVVALMALDILKGEGLPLLFYGQHYMGTLDAFGAALWFAGLGVSSEAYKLSLLPYAAVTLGLVGWTVARLWGAGPALVAVGLVALSPAAIRWQIDQPNYGMLFLFAAALFALTASLLEGPDGEEPPAGAGRWYAWAFVAGLGFWMHSLILGLLLPVPLLLRLRGTLPRGRRLAWGCFWFLVGAAPLLIHNVAHGFATVRQFGGFFLDVSSRDQVQGLSLLEIALRGLWHKVNPATVGPNILVALGGYDLRDYPLLLALSYPAAAAFATLLVGAALAWFRGARRSGWRAWTAGTEGGLLAWLWLSVGLVLLLGSTRARYLALLILLSALLLAGRWGRQWPGKPWRAALLGGLLLYLAAASVTLNVLRPLVAPNPVPALAAFLQARGLALGYAGFELAYPLAVATKESVKVTPLAGPVVDDRYPAYTRAVEAAPAPFYLYAEREPLGAALAGYLRAEAIAFNETTVEGHRVFWGLSSPVRPDEFLPEPYLSAYRRVHP